MEVMFELGWIVNQHIQLGRFWTNISLKIQIPTQQFFNLNLVISDKGNVEICQQTQKILTTSFCKEKYVTSKLIQIKNFSCVQCDWPLWFSLQHLKMCEFCLRILQILITYNLYAYFNIPFLFMCFPFEVLLLKQNIAFNQLEILLFCNILYFYFLH